jgi:thaumarchaeosortase
VFGLKNGASERYIAFLLKLLPLISFAAPLALLYLVNPFDASLNVTVQASFELMWKGRTFQLFFIWLIALELILGWENITSQINLQNKARIVAFAVALALPSLYILSEFYGLNGTLAAWSHQSGIAFADSMPLAIEYLVFSALFLLTVFISNDKKGMVDFILPAIFVALIGILYTIDNVFPYGEFTPFQLLVPTTASLAAGVLRFMGYTVVPGFEASTGMPTLDVSGSTGTAMFAIAWPCAGIESLLIFTAVSLMFLKRMNISLKAKLSFFIIGAAVTYFINILRITQIFVIGTQYGEYSLEVNSFHYYYGPLYAMTWIVLYPLIIITLTLVWQKIRKHQPAPLNSV